MSLLIPSLDRQNNPSAGQDSYDTSHAVPVAVRGVLVRLREKSFT